MAGIFDRCNEPSGSTKCYQFLEKLQISASQEEVSSMELDSYFVFVTPNGYKFYDNAMTTEDKQRLKDSCD
jgi:hypothetical protein